MKYDGRGLAKRGDDALMPPGHWLAEVIDRTKRTENNLDEYHINAH